MKKKQKRYDELMALKGKLREKKYSYQQLATQINITPSTLCEKINGYYPLTHTEIEKIADVLDIKVNEIANYFFPRLLRKLNIKSISLLACLYNLDKFTII